MLFRSIEQPVVLARAGQAVGVQMSVHMGRVLADVIGGKPSASPWLELDWHAIPGNFGDPWYLPFVGAYFRVQDMLH